MKEVHMTSEPSKRELFLAIHAAAKPCEMKRTIERTIYDGDGKLVRTETEVQSWTEPGDAGAMQWAIKHRIPPE